MSMFTRKNPAQLQAQLAAMKSSGKETDPKVWTSETDANGNGTFVIRFLPARDDNSMPFIHKVTHFFKGAGNVYYSEACTSTHGDFKSCPVCTHIKAHDLYNTDNDAYGNMKRGHSYWANILIVKDPNRPDNEGKVFKYRFGQKIMDKIHAEMNVDESIGEVPVDVSCLYGGKNFTLKIKKVGKHANYEDSKFQVVTEVPRIAEPEYQKWLVDEMSDIQVLVAPSAFKSKEENEKTLREVLGTAAGGSGASAANKQASSMENELSQFDQQMEQFDATPEKTVEDVKLNTPQSSDDTVDDLLKGLNLGI